MTREELVQVAKRLANGPAPTSYKKVYGYQGELSPLLEALPPTVTVRTRVTDACRAHDLPSQAERIPGYLRDRLATHLQTLQHGRSTSITLMQEAVLLLRYQTPLSFLYDLTGDAHAIILHVDGSFSPKEWTFPSYVHYNPDAVASAIAQIVGSQFVREDRGQGARP